MSSVSEIWRWPAFILTNLKNVHAHRYDRVERNTASDRCKFQINNWVFMGCSSKIHYPLLNEKTFFQGQCWTAYFFNLRRFLSYIFTLDVLCCKYYFHRHSGKYKEYQFIFICWVKDTRILGWVKHIRGWTISTVLLFLIFNFKWYDMQEVYHNLDR